jgi:hypothetical protein
VVQVVLVLQVDVVHVCVGQVDVVHVCVGQVDVAHLCESEVYCLGCSCCARQYFCHQHHLHHQYCQQVLQKGCYSV